MENDVARYKLNAAAYFYNLAQQLEIECEKEGDSKEFREMELAYLKAVKYYQDAALSLERADLWEKAGDILLTKLVREKEAIRAYEKALELDHGNKPLLKKLGEAYLGMTINSEYAFAKNEALLKASELFLEYLAEFPQDYDALTSLGNALYKRKEYERAKEYYEKALSIKPDDYRVLWNAAQNYVALGNYEMAIRMHEKLCEIKHDSPHPFADLARLYCKLGEYEKAIEHWNMALERCPDCWGYWQELEDCYANLGRYDEAKKCRVKALEIKAKREEEESAWQKSKKLTASRNNNDV
jgi:tetratricopeptide (TPR) repeat protein